ncbi:uncharacterized protein LOC112003170 isoform X4 [Quercus suber]|uniref:uncharacterized protein LOC112003170 isoform X4 n=1 Tax=Quercus suber TaxID=58331 RepID=UPI0032DF4F50
MEWKERMLGLQIEHEKQMMQMQAEACQNQMQVLGVMARLVCQFFGSASDGLGGALGGLPPQFCIICSIQGDWATMGSWMQIRLLNSCRNSVDVHKLAKASSCYQEVKHGYGHDMKRSVRHWYDMGSWGTLPVA